MLIDLSGLKGKYREHKNSCHARKARWHLWYAWYPVKIQEEGVYAWLQKVERRWARVSEPWEIIRYFEWKYRMPKDEE